MDGSASLLDAAMPAYDVHEVHEARVRAGPEAVWSALHEVPLRAVPVFRGLRPSGSSPGSWWVAGGSPPAWTGPSSSR